MAKFVLVVFFVAFVVSKVELLTLQEAAAVLQGFCGTNGIGTVEQIREGTKCALDYASKNMPKLNILGLFECHGPEGQEAETERERCMKEGGVAADKPFMECSVIAAGGEEGLAKVPKEKTDEMVQKCFNYP